MTVDLIMKSIVIVVLLAAGIAQARNPVPCIHNFRKIFALVFHNPRCQCSERSLAVRGSKGHEGHEGDIGHPGREGPTGDDHESDSGRLLPGGSQPTRHTRQSKICHKVCAQVTQHRKGCAAWMARLTPHQQKLTNQITFQLNRLLEKLLDKKKKAAKLRGKAAAQLRAECRFLEKQVGKKLAQWQGQVQGRKLQEMRFGIVPQKSEPERKKAKPSNSDPAWLKAQITEKRKKLAQTQEYVYVSNLERAKATRYENYGANLGLMWMEKNIPSLKEEIEDYLNFLAEKGEEEEHWVMTDRKKARLFNWWEDYRKPVLEKTIDIEQKAKSEIEGAMPLFWYDIKREQLAIAEWTFQAKKLKAACAKEKSAAKLEQLKKELAALQAKISAKKAEHQKATDNFFKTYDRVQTDQETKQWPLIKVYEERKTEAESQMAALDKKHEELFGKTSKQRPVAEEEN